MTQRGGWWRRTNPNIVIPAFLVAVVVTVALTSEPERVVTVERRVEVPGPERIVTVKAPADSQEERSHAFTARQVSDLTARRLAKAGEIATAQSRVSNLIKTLSTHGHRFPDNSVIQNLGGPLSPGRYTYEEWARLKAQREDRHVRIPESMRYRGEELALGNWNHYDFEKIERHARYLYDPDKNADLKVKWWPGARYESWSFKPDTYERQLIAAHHAVWKAEAELSEIESELDRLGN